MDGYRCQVLNSQRQVRNGICTTGQYALIQWQLTEGLILHLTESCCKWPIDRYATGMSIYMQPIVRLNTPATVSFVAQLTIAVTAMVRDRAHCTVHFWATTRFGEYLIRFTYRLQWFNYLFRTNCYTLLHKYETFCDEKLKLYITMLLWYLIFTKLLTASMCFMYVCMCCCSADWRLAKVMLCTVFQLLPFIYLIFINLLCSAAVAAAAVC